MAGIVTIREEYLTDIADAIREQTDSEMPLTTDAMAPAIRSIERGGANVDLSDYATIEYVDQKIAEIEPGSGSNITVDGQTIIEENGIIRTAIGGGVTTYIENEEFYSYLVEDNETQAIYSEDGRFYIPDFSVTEYYNTAGMATVQIDVDEWPEGLSGFGTTGVLKGTMVDRQIYIEDNGSTFCGDVIQDDADGRAYIEHRASEEYPNAVITNIWMRKSGAEIQVPTPINSQFVPIDNDTIIDIGGAISAQPLRERIDDLESRIGSGGGGGSANVDGLTIINDGGVLRTAIGGYRIEPSPGEILYENYEVVGPTFEEYMGEYQLYIGYFALPNWTPLGEEYIGKYFRARWLEFPSLDDSDYCVECFADAWILDEGHTIIIDNRENSELVEHYLDNNTGYLACMPHLFDNQAEYGHTRISEFRLEIQQIEGEAIPINADFIPIDHDTITIQDGRLVAAGGVSEDRVSEMITEALGVIENGTY